MWVLIRAIVWATLFVSFLLVWLPARVLARSGIPVVPPAMGAGQIAAMILAGAGAVIAAWCILTFVFIGKGTAAPFDPPRRLVVSGPYRFVRNPMYVGAGLALCGAGVFYRSIALVGYALVFFVVLDQFVRWYEEPTLRRLFGTEYEAYCRGVRRWWPIRP